MNTLDTNNIKWSENVIIADADYIDKVAFDLTVNFERMINRRIQPADIIYAKKGTGTKVQKNIRNLF
jgi:hypothetical protein